MTQKAKVYETRAQKIVNQDKDLQRLYALNRQRITIKQVSISPGGATPSSAGSSGGTGNFLETQGDVMVGPIAFNPVLVAINSDGHIAIGEDDRTTANGPIDYSTYVLMTGAGSPDDLNFIDGAGFNGQLLYLQGTASQIINVKTATLPFLTSISGTGTVSVVTAIDHNLTTGDKVNILGTTNFDVQNVSVTVTGATTFTYSDAGDSTPESSGQVQDGNIVTDDGNDVVMDGTVAVNGVPVITLIFDPLIPGFGGWRVISTGGGGSSGGNEFADNVFRIFDDIDNTRKLGFQVGGIAASTTRIVTVQDEDGVMMLLDGSGTQIVVQPTEFRDTSFFLRDDIDNTRRVTFQTGGISASTLRTFTFQDEDGVFMLLNGGGTQIVTQPTEFRDSSFFLRDDIDNTRRLTFQVGAIAASTLRTLTVQNASGTIPLLDGAAGEQVFTNTIRIGGSAVLNVDGNDLILDDDGDSKFVTSVDDILILNLAGGPEYNWSTTGYDIAAKFMNLSEIAVPGAPGSTSGRIFLDSADNTLKIRKSSGTVNLESSDIIQEGDSFVEVVDLGTGTVTTQVDGVPRITVIAGQTTFFNTIVVSGVNISMSGGDVDLNDRDLLEVRDIYMQAGFQTSKLFFDGGFDTYMTASGTPDRINMVLGNDNDISFLANAGILLFNDTYVQMDERASDPAAGSVTGKFYVKTVGGLAKPFFIGDGTAAVDLSAGGGGGEFFGPWTATHDAGDQNLDDLNILTMNGDGSGIQSIDFINFFNAGSTLNMGNGLISSVDTIDMNGSGSRIQDLDDLDFNGSGSTLVQLDTLTMLDSGSFIDMNLGDILDAADVKCTTVGTLNHEIEFDSSHVGIVVFGTGDFISFDDGTGARITYDYNTDDFSPLDNIASCGKSGRRWIDVWAVDGSINTSFSEFKREIVEQPDGDCLEACARLVPIKYKWKTEIFRDTKDFEGRNAPRMEQVHFGYKADSLKQDMPEAVTGNVGQEGIYEQSVIGLLIGSIRHLKARIEQLETP